MGPSMSDPRLAAVSDGAEATAVATYTRRSTDEEHQRFSIEMQDDRLDKYVGSQESWHLTTTYSDDKSGATLDRPGLQRLLRDARAGRFSMLLVYRVDRLSRSLRGLVHILDELDKAGVAFRSATEPFETATPAGRMMVQLLGIFAEFERATIIERVVGGMERKAARGEWTTGTAPFGYSRAKGEPTLTIDQGEAAVVRRIFITYLKLGLGVRAVADQLNTQGSRSRRGRLWSGQQILNMLRNRAYIGDVFFRGCYRTGLHEPLLERTLFDEVQSLLKERGEDAVVRPTVSDFLLSGRVICGRCQHHYVGVSGHGRWGGRFRYYMCQGRNKRGTRQCTAPNVSAPRLEDAVLDALRQTFVEPLNLERALTAARAELREHQPAYSEQLIQVEAELRKARSQIERYLEAFDAGTLPEAVCGDHLRALAARTAELELRRDQLNSAIDEAPTDPYATVDIDAARKAILHAFETENEPAYAAERADLVRSVVHEIRIESAQAVHTRFRLPVPPGAPGGAPRRDLPPPRPHQPAQGRGSHGVKLGTPGGT